MSTYEAFLSHEQLHITHTQHYWLIETLKMLEGGTMRWVALEDLKIDELADLIAANQRLPPGTFSNEFNMCNWTARHNCGTVGCIGGTAELISNGVCRFEKIPPKLDDLFYPKTQNYDAIKVEEAAQGLRNYLTIGSADWRGVMGDEAYYFQPPN